MRILSENLACGARENGRVIAVVRGSSNENAAQRLRAAYDSVDTDLIETFDALRLGRLTVYAGGHPESLSRLPCVAFVAITSSVNSLGRPHAD